MNAFGHLRGERRLELPQRPERVLRLLDLLLQVGLLHGQLLPGGVGVPERRSQVVQALRGVRQLTLQDLVLLVQSSLRGEREREREQTVL